MSTDDLNNSLTHFTGVHRIPKPLCHVTGENSTCVVGYDRCHMAKGLGLNAGNDSTET